MEYTVEAARSSDKGIIQKLLQAYLAELAHFPDENPDYQDENSIYHYPYLDAHWVEDVRYPYFFYAGSEMVGFALIRKEDGNWQMAEFYVLPAFRRKDLATTCAAEIFKKHPGQWHIYFNKHNQPSQNLWHKLANKFAQGDIEEGESDSSHEYIQFSL